MVGKGFSPFADISVAVPGESHLPVPAMHFAVVLALVCLTALSLCSLRASAPFKEQKPAPVVAGYGWRDLKNLTRTCYNKAPNAVTLNLPD